MVWLIFLRQHSGGPGGREPSNNLIRDQTYTVMEEGSSLTCRIILLSWLISALASPLTPPPSSPLSTLCDCVCIKGSCNVSRELPDEQCTCWESVWRELKARWWTNRRQWCDHRQQTPCQWLENMRATSSVGFFLCLVQFSFPSFMTNSRLTFKIIVHTQAYIHSYIYIYIHKYADYIFFSMLSVIYSKQTVLSECCCSCCVKQETFSVHSLNIERRTFIFLFLS